MQRNQMRGEKIEPYKINFAPTLVLTDSKGKIVNASTKRSKSIHEDIDLLLAKMIIE